MKKFLTFSIILLVSIFVFNNNVKATDSYKNINSYVLENSYGYDYYNSNDRYNLLKNYNNSIGVFFDTEKNNIIMTKYNKDYIIPLKTDDYNTQDIVVEVDDYNIKVYLFNGQAFDSVSSDGTTYNFTALSDYAHIYIMGSSFYTSYYNEGKYARLFATYQIKYFASNFDIKYSSGGIAIAKTFDTTFLEVPEINISKYKEIKDDENIISEVIKISLSNIDDEEYNYYWKFEDSEWRKVDSSNFEENYTTYTIEQNGTFYFKIEDKNENIINSATYTTNNINRTPKVKYKIEIDEEDDFVKDEYVKNNRTIYNIKLEYSYMTNEYYSVYYNLKDGTKKNLGFNVQNYEIKYVNDDAIITIYIYDKNNNVVNFTTIDLQNINKDLNNPYIYVTGYNQENLPNSVAYKYINANDDDNKCYYKFGGGDLTSESCSSDETKFRKAYYNTSLSLYIYDNNNNILDEKHLNLNFINGFPRLEFESYYSAISKGQVLNIKLFDYLDNDTLYYSVDNKKWEQLATQELNSLIFTEDTQVYFKIYRNNEDIADSYYYVKIGNYSISISENNTKDEIKDLTKSQTGFINTFLKQINSYLVEFSKILIYFYNSLNPSIKACITALFVLSIICVVILIARGKR